MNQGGLSNMMIRVGGGPSRRIGFFESKVLYWKEKINLILGRYKYYDLVIRYEDEQANVKIVPLGVKRLDKAVAQFFNWKKARSSSVKNPELWIKLSDPIRTPMTINGKPHYQNGGYWEVFVSENGKRFFPAMHYRLDITT